MINKSLEKTQMPVQDPKTRVQNFCEVELGYSLDLAQQEAQRCLNCPNKPCQSCCPAQIDIPSFIKKIVENNIEEAYKELKKYTTLPAVCGRICPQELQCEKVCVRGRRGQSVAIGRLERFVADFCEKTPVVEQKKLHNNKKVAIIGSGPAGLSAANVLADLGYSVTVFEQEKELGGVLVYGIPEFRLPKKVIQFQIDLLKSKFVKFLSNIQIGSSLTIDSLFEKENFNAVFIATGAAGVNLPKQIDVSAPNVYSAQDFLKKINQIKFSKKINFNKVDKLVVVGGGNVAIDVARAAIRGYARSVQIVYRRTMEQMPAFAAEIKEAKQENIQFVELVAPKSIALNEKKEIKGLNCIKCELIPSDDFKKSSPKEIEDSEFLLDCNSVVFATGSYCLKNVFDGSTISADLMEKENIAVDENTMQVLHTDSKKPIFAGGDVVSGPATAVLAMKAGLKAAEQIDILLCKTTQK